MDMRPSGVVVNGTVQLKITRYQLLVEAINAQAMYSRCNSNASFGRYLEQADSLDITTFNFPGHTHSRTNRVVWLSG